MSDTSNEAIAAYGWQAVPRDMEALLKLSASSSSGPAKTIDISSITLPNSELANKVKAYAQEQLPKQTFHHSMRVYYYGTTSPSQPSQNQKANTTRPSNPPPRLPNLVQPNLQRNIPPNLPPPRHRHHPPKHLQHPHVLRIPRRFPLPEPPILALSTNPTGGKRRGVRDPTPGFGGQGHVDADRRVDSAGDGV